MDRTVIKGGKVLRCGFTTGSAASAAAMAATKLLLCGVRCQTAKITLPSGEALTIEIAEAESAENWASCGVVKDGGDDPDATNGILITARAEKRDEGFLLKGGAGVGRITQKGLKLRVGEAAINPVPRKMIEEGVLAVCRECSYFGGIEITISARGGEEVAERTFNPRLGIVGGISILGTTGIVEPMSEPALIATIQLEIDKRAAENHRDILLCPGNYGRSYCREKLGFDLDKGVKYSNYLGEALDYAVYRGFERVLLVSHMGKLVKVAAGVMNTHSAVADCRMEVFAAHAAVCGMSREKIRAIMECSVTEAALNIIEREGLLPEVCRSIEESIRCHIDFRTKKRLKAEFIAFRSENNLLLQSSGAEEYAAAMKY